jgi:hypothetical protein
LARRWRGARARLRQPLQHSPSHNARYVKEFDANVVAFVALVAISAGEEITVDDTDDGRNELWFDV